MGRYIVTLTRNETYVIDEAQDEDHAKLVALELWNLDDARPEILDVTEDPMFALENPPEAAA